MPPTTTAAHTTQPAGVERDVKQMRELAVKAKAWKEFEESKNRVPARQAYSFTYRPDQGPYDLTADWLAEI